MLLLMMSTSGEPKAFRRIEKVTEMTGIIKDSKFKDKDRDDDEKYDNMNKIGNNKKAGITRVTIWVKQLVQIAAYLSKTLHSFSRRKHKPKLSIYRTNPQAADDFPTLA